MTCERRQSRGDRASCVRLERFYLYDLSSVIPYLPPDGLPTLRHLRLINCALKDADLAWLLERQPGLETVCLVSCGKWRFGGPGLTHSGLALFGRMAALRSLSLSYVPGVCDWALDHLNKAPLTELQLRGHYWGLGVTAEGLLRLTQSCPLLRWATFSFRRNPDTTIDCQSEVGEQELIRVFKNSFSIVCCRLSATAPADYVCTGQQTCS